MMTWLSRLWKRIGALGRRRELDADLDAELAHHLEMKSRHSDGGGDTTATAQRALGSRAYWLEQTRAEWTFPRLEAWWADLRYAARRLRHDRVFTLVATLTLVLGTGATTAVFSLLNGLRWRPLPVVRPGEMVRLALTHLPPSERHWLDGRQVPALERNTVSFAMYEALARHDEAFSGFFALGGSGSIHVEHQGVPRQVKFNLVTGSMFSVLGVAPQAGRLFEPADDLPGGSPDGAPWPAVISDALWTSMFNRSRSAVGARIIVDQVPFVVAGVCPPSFKGLNPGSEFDLWIPLSASEAMFPLFQWRHKRSVRPLRPFARLRPGVQLEQAARYLAAVAPAVMEEAADPAKSGQERAYDLAIHVEPRPAANGFSMLAVSYLKPLTILMAAVGAVLLIAATNLTSLFLARTASRRHELAIRVSLGAPAARLRRALLLESALIATAGLAGGLILSRVLAVALQGLVSESIRIDTSLDLRMFAFLGLVLLMVTLVAGLGPALQAGRSQPQTALKNAAGGPAPGALRVRAGLVVLQTALSLALTAGAGIMLASLRGLVDGDTGLDRHRSVFLWPDLLNAGLGRDRMTRAYENILAQLRAQPDIEAAGWTDTVPLSGNLSSYSVDVEGRSDLPLPQREVFSILASEGYLAGTGIRLRAGVDLPGPTSARTNVAVISETAARRFFGSPEAAIGRHLRPAKQDWLEITGVAADSKYYSVRQAHPPAIYRPYWAQQPPRPGLSLALHYRGGAGEAGAVAAATRVFEREAGRRPFVEVRTIDGLLRGAAGTERLLAWLLTAMAALALLISATGLAGLLSYLVEQRRKDFGIRLALGASRRHVQGLILRHGLLLSGAGVLLGAALSYFLRRTLDSFLFGISPADPRIWLAGGALMVAAALIACAAPAWRAARIDPVRMLRGDAGS